MDNGDDESVVDRKVVDCTTKNFTFHEMLYGGKNGDFILVCAWQEIDHVQTSEKQCTHAMQHIGAQTNNKIISQNLSISDKSNTKLPLILTLVFLCVGIIGLVILHNVVKGYLSDRRGAVSAPSFLCSIHHWRNKSWRNCRNRSNRYSYQTARVFAFQREDGEEHLEDRGNSSWLNRLWSSFSRKILYRRQHHTVNGDEAALEDEFCTEMSFVS